MPREASPHEARQARQAMLGGSAGTVVWRYQFEPVGDGTRLTESYTVTRPVSRLGWFVIGRLYGSRDRRAELRAGMQQTVERIRDTAERDTKPGHVSPHTAATP